MKFRFIDEQLQAYPVGLSCRVLQVSRAGYYAWRARPLSRQRQRREQLAQQIRQVHQEHRCRYGSPRIYQVLKARGQRVCQNTVAKLMRSEGLRAKAKRTFVPRTTDSRHTQPVAPNQLDRQFHAARPNTKWVADITYIPTAEGWLYLAGVLDLFSRKVVGWAVADHLEASLAGQALETALWHRRPAGGLVHHSDRGVQYASDAYQGRLADWGIQISMSNKGDCYDNAAMESFWATLKSELVHHEQYQTRAEARLSIFEYIEGFYNRTRLHSSLGYVSPEAFEAAAS